MPNKKTNEEFIKELKTKNPLIQAMDFYVNSTTKLQCKCLVCNNIWYAAPNHLLHGEGCPVCGRRKIAAQKQYSKELFSEKVHNLHPNIEVIGEYINSQTKIEVHCKTCGNQWAVVPSSLLQGTGCPKCHRRYRRNTAEFIEELKSVSPHIKVIGNYKNAHQKIYVHCNRCGTEWYGSPIGLLKGNDCPVCNHNQTSIVEQIFYYSFIQLVGKENVINRSKTLIGKEIDIYIKSLNLAIEFGAWYWHADRIDKDIEKESLCERAGVKLITIYEGCPDNVDTGSLKNVVCYKQSISGKKDYLTVKSFISGLCQEYDLDETALNNNWDNILKTAQESSRKKDAEQFVKELSIINPDIEYLGEYTGVKDPVYVQCKKCGTKWHASSVYGLLHGIGCPECAKTKRGLSNRTDQADFLEQVAMVNPDIEVLEEYKGSGVSILCRCKICGTKWMAKPEHIRYKKRNCPKCSPVTKKTNEEFLEELTLISKTIHPMEGYINGRTSISFKCDICGYEWKAKPNDVLQSTGCPKCAHHVPITHDEFVKRVHNQNENIEIIGTYSSSKVKIKCRCKICGYEWFGIPNNLLRGAGCQKCAGTLRITNEEFIKRISIVNPNVIPLETYINNHTKIKCRCGTCGHEWSATPGNLLKGHGCPKCKALNAKKLKSKKIICIETGQVYNSISEAKSITGITTISDCLNHRTKTAGGYKWQYIENANENNC